MHLALFLQDLAVIMIVAGIVTVIFHRLKQPVVLGYILAGVILGPYTPPFSFIHDTETVKTLAELGVMFLMFSLGLEFSVTKLFHVGRVAAIAALAEIIFMIIIGYALGQLFGWSSIDSLFLGAMLAISSTTIIIKALNELKMQKESFAQTIFGILIIEDILAVAILVLLSSIAISGHINTSDVMITLGKLFVFLISSLVIGILIVPKIISYVAQFKSREMLLITVLGLSFGFSLLVIHLGYSVALGAFLIGAIMAESREIKLIERMIHPLTNMFSAIFFVSIGLLVNFHIIVAYIIPILIVTLTVVLGKVIICSLAVFLAGRDGRTSMRVGMGLAQIGEFSFIIASLGISLDVTSSFLYPIIVAVSAITTFLTPYLIKLADPLTAWIARNMPKRAARAFNTDTTLVEAKLDEHAIVMFAVKRSLLQIFINFILVVGIFIAAAYLVTVLKNYISFIPDLKLQKALIWGGCLIISLPFLVAIYFKLQAISMIYAEMMSRESCEGEDNAKWRYFVVKMLPYASMLGVIAAIIAISAHILPPLILLFSVIGIAVLLTALLWRWFIRLHSRLQIAFIETLDKKDKH